MEVNKPRFADITPSDEVKKSRFVDITASHSSDGSSSGSPDPFCGIKTTLTSEEYDAATIRAEFKTYQAILPKPSRLLQQQHSVEKLREMMEDGGIDMPRFLSHPYEGGIAPHYALCCLLLKDYPDRGGSKETGVTLLWSWTVWVLSFGLLYRQRHLPADIIYEQFNRIAHVVPGELIRPEKLRRIIRNSGLPIPNFFLDPEDDKQFPPHIALLVILQDGQKESDYLDSTFNHIAWFFFAFVALILRLVLEVIGGAGAIWGGTEVFFIRDAGNADPCRWASIVVGLFCFLRFVILNAPHHEDEGDILGPAGPWSLRSAARYRAVCNHPFHYFVRASRPYSKAKDAHPI